MFFYQFNIAWWHDVVINVNFWGVQNLGFLREASLMTKQDDELTFVLTLSQCTRLFI